MQNESNERAVRVAVIGGGAAGMMAAGTALSMGAEVTVFEHIGRLGKKLAITGKGRCNVTNDCTREEFIQNVLSNPRFMYAPLSAFSPEDTIAFFEKMGVKLKTERGRRVFPVSDKAADIVGAMKKYCLGAKIIYEKVTKILVNGERAVGVRTDKDYAFDSVILATGGKSYPLTGSDGSGYALATAIGHTVTELTPSLVPVEAYGSYAQRMQGLSLKNVSLKIKDGDNRTVYEDFGELLFTHFGMSGPMILSATSHLRGYKLDTLTAEIDMKPALDERALDARILSDFSQNPNKDFANSLGALLPSKMIDIIIEDSKIDPHKKVNAVTREERRRLVSSLKSLKIRLKRLRPIDEAIITSGGIAVKEISPKTMMSTKVRSLYFAGEVIDVDAYTGGYNLQIAFSTGYVSGINAAGKENLC